MESLEDGMASLSATAVLRPFPCPPLEQGHADRCCRHGLQVLNRVAHLRVAEAQRVQGNEEDSPSADEQHGSFCVRYAICPAKEPPPIANRKRRRLNRRIMLKVGSEEPVQASMVIWREVDRQADHFAARIVTN